MNQRILELAKQAGIKANSEQAMSPQEQLFAQLMVQDCIRILHGHGYDDAAKCLQEIHFGIENPV